MLYQFSSVMVARSTWVVEVQFLLEYGNINPHREDRFDSGNFQYDCYMSIRRAWTTDGGAGRCASALTHTLACEVKGTSAACHN